MSRVLALLQQVCNKAEMTDEQLQCREDKTAVFGWRCKRHAGGAVSLIQQAQ